MIASIRGGGLITHAYFWSIERVLWIQLLFLLVGGQDTHAHMWCRSRGRCQVTVSVAPHRLFWKAIFHWPWSSLTQQDFRDPPVSVSPALGLQEDTTWPSLCMGPGDLSSGPPACSTALSNTDFCLYVCLIFMTEFLYVALAILELTL